MRPLSLTRIGIVLTLTLACLVTLTPGCTIGEEGERCNPLLSHDECNGELTCQQPVDCPETYCCPTPVTASSSPFCQAGCNGGRASICAAAQYYGVDSGIDCTDAGPAAETGHDTGSHDVHSD